MLKHMLVNNRQEDITLFEDGISCLDQLHQKPDIVFLDYNMDVYSGFVILRKIKRFNPNIHVVVISGQDDIKTAVNTLKHGAFDYIEKKADLEENIIGVLNKIEEVNKILAQKKPSFLKSIFKFL
jgi:polysaccharide export outer membrane protein